MSTVDEKQDPPTEQIRLYLLHHSIISKIIEIVKKYHIYNRVHEYLKFAVRHMIGLTEIQNANFPSPTKKLVIIQFVKLLTTKDD